MTRAVQIKQVQSLLDRDKGLGGGDLSLVGAMAATHPWSHQRCTPGPTSPSVLRNSTLSLYLSLSLPQFLPLSLPPSLSLSLSLSLSYILSLLFLFLPSLPHVRKVERGLT